MRTTFPAYLILVKAVAQLVEVLHYKPEGRWFDSLRYHRSFHWHNPSGLTMVEMSTRNISWRVKVAGHVGLATLPRSCANCHEIWEPQPPGTLRASPDL
jgi:hypothetical protein